MTDKYHNKWIGEVSINAPDGLGDFAESVVKAKMEEAQVIVDKQRDYGPGNINAFGDYGVLVRLNDKVERLKTLYASGDMPQHESVDDSWLDGSNYGTIARMYRRGDWPK